MKKNRLTWKIYEKIYNLYGEDPPEKEQNEGIILWDFLFCITFGLAIGIMYKIVSKILDFRINHKK